MLNVKSIINKHNKTDLDPPTNNSEIIARYQGANLLNKSSEIMSPPKQIRVRSL